MQVSKQQEAIAVLRAYGFVTDSEGHFVTMRGEPLRVYDQRWDPLVGEGFLRFDRDDGQWVSTPYKMGDDGVLVWVYPDEHLIRDYGRPEG